MSLQDYAIKQDGNTESECSRYVSSRNSSG
jgi:hypothetical protein